MNLTVVSDNPQEQNLPVVHVIVVGEPSIHQVLCNDPLFNVYPECMDYQRFMQLATTKQIQVNKFIIVLSDSLSERVVNFSSVLSLVKNRAVVIAWQMSQEEKLSLGISHILENPTANSLRGYIAHRAGLPKVPSLPEDTLISAPDMAEVVQFHSNNEMVEDTENTESNSQVENQSGLSRRERRLLKEQQEASSLPFDNNPVESVETPFDFVVNPKGIPQDSVENVVSTSSPLQPKPKELNPFEQQVNDPFGISYKTNFAIEDSYDPTYYANKVQGNHGLDAPLVLSVYSPKGGVGKTSIAVNMASRLAYTSNLQVCIIDIDIGFGNVGTRLGLFTPTMRELLAEPDVDSDALSRHLAYDRRSGLYALLAPLRPESCINRNIFSPFAFSKVLELLKERFDVIFLDCPVELRDPLVSHFAIPKADKVVMVINNEQATLLDARRAIEAMVRPQDSQRLPGLGIPTDRIGLIVNQKVDNVGREINDIKSILSGGDSTHPSNEIELLSIIPDDRQLWVGNANLARPVVSDGNSEVELKIDEALSKVIPKAEEDHMKYGHSNNEDEYLDDIFSAKPKSTDKKSSSIFDRLRKKDD